MPVADVSAEVEFEDRVLSVRATLKRIINTTDAASVPGGDDVFVQLLQRQMELMERHKASSSRATTTPITCEPRDLEVDEQLGTLLQTQTEILQHLSKDTTDDVVNGNRVKLLAIKLPFDGKIEEWAQFSDAFTNTIHDNKVLPSIQKFIYLRSNCCDRITRNVPRSGIE